MLYSTCTCTINDCKDSTKPCIYIYRSLFICCFISQANGFYGGRGVAGHVPVMYIHFAKKFLERVSALQAEHRVRYLEYFRNGWTFHGKGLWYYPEGEELPLMSIIGSSNYGERL